MNNASRRFSAEEILDTTDAGLYEVGTQAAGPAGKLPLTDEMLLDWPSGDLFGLTQNAGMGWSPAEMLGPQMLMLSTQGGIRGEDGRPIALGYHTGHWEVGLLMRAAAAVIKAAGGVRLPLSAPILATVARRVRPACSTVALPHDAALVLRRLIRSLPTDVAYSAWRPATKVCRP